MAIDTGNLIPEGLFNRRTVVISDEITHRSIDEAINALLALQLMSANRINLVIDSGGGRISAALKLCDLITTVLTAPVRGIAFGTCGSAATFIMLHCTERVSTPYADFLLHSGTASQISIPIGETTSSHLERLLEEAKEADEQIIQVYMSRLTPVAWKLKKQSDAEKREYVRKLLARGDQPFHRFLSAEQAVEIGIITDILSEKLDIFSV